MKQPPEGWKSVAPADLLTEEQMCEVAAVLASTEDTDSKVRQLKTMFSLLREQLEAKGVLPEYLAYAVVGAYAGMILKPL